MNKDKNTYVTKTLVSQESLSELDFFLHDKFNFDYENGGSFENIENGFGNTGEAFPMDIDTMIEMLQEMKKKGATHIEIEHHVDHIGYDISAYEIRKSTKEEIEVFKDKSIKEAEKQKKLKKLYAEINKLQNEK